MAIKPLNSVAGFSIGEIPSVVIDANGNITANTFDVTSTTNLGNIGNITIDGGSSGQVIQTDGLGNLSFVTVATWQLQNGNSNIQVLANSNVTVSVSGTANVATFTDTGANFVGYLDVQGNITANGNINVNNHIVTPTSANLIVAPATQITRFYSNINPYTTETYDLGAGLERWGNLFVKTANISGTAIIGNVKTDNLLYANGAPWDFQQPAGSNNYVQYNSNGDFGASANFTYNDATQLLTLNGNLLISNASATNGIKTDKLYYSNGQPWDLQEAAGSNTQIQYNNGLNNFGASANFTFDSATNNVTINGNIIIGSSGKNQIVNAGANVLEIRGGLNDANGIVAMAAGDYGNSLNWGKISIYGNIGGNATAQLEANIFNFQPGGGGANVIKFDVLSYNATTTTSGAVQVAGGIGATGNVYIGGNLSVAGDIANANNITTTNDLSVGRDGNIGRNLNVVGNIANANNITTTNDLSVGRDGNIAGNLVVIGNIANANNITTTNDLAVGGDGNIAGDLVVIGNIANANNITATNDLTVGANASITDTLTTDFAQVTSLTSTQILYANSTSYLIGNVNFTYNDTSNTMTVTGNANVTLAVNTGNINSGTNNNLILTANSKNTTYYANGDVTFPANVSANTFNGNFSGNFAAPGSNTYVLFNDNNLSNAVANFTYDKAYNSNGGLLNVGNTVGGRITTDNVYAAYANINGNANVAGNLNLIKDLQGNTATFSGDISAANVTTPNVFGSGLKLNSTSGNLLLVVDSGNIAVNNVPINNLANPSLAQDAATKYYVDQQVAAGLDIHDSVNADSDIGNNLNATYVDGGTTPTWTSITGTDTLVTGSAHGLSVNDVIVFGVTANGITAGTPYFVAATPSSTSIKITLTWDGSPITGLTNGTGLSITSLANSGVGATLTSNTNGTLTLEGYTLQLNDRVLIIGQTNQWENGVYDVTDAGSADPGGTPWELTRSSDANKYGLYSPNLLATGAYFLVTGGDDKGESYVLNTVGTIVFGTTNITFAEFSIITPYTAGTGLGLYGNSQFYIANTTVTPNSYGNGDRVASFTVNGQGQLTAASDVVITSNAANLTGTSLASTINTSNLTSLGTLTGLAVNGDANVSANILTNTLTVNLALSGNTANFTGAVLGNTIGLKGNLVIANVANGGTAGAGVVTDNLYYSNGSAWDFQLPAGSNTQIQYNDGNGGFGASANLTFNQSTNVLGVTGNANVSGSLILGDSRITSATVTTIGAGATIASTLVSGITGVEYFVKAVDSTGAKYTVATVQAVTDGANVEYSTYGLVNIGGYVGSLSVDVVGGYIRLLANPASSNSTVWTTQYRMI